MHRIFTSWKNFLDEEKMSDLGSGGAYVAKVGGLKVVIDLDDLDLQATKHSKERQFRHDRKISNEAIVGTVEMALGKIINDYANGELANDEAFHIKGVSKAKSVPDLNVIGVLNMKKGPDTLKVITVMRKDDFKTDSFGGGQQRTYTVNPR
jgi:hypothetical protein